MLTVQKSKITKMNKYLLLAAFMISGTAFCQIGINTQDPKTTLDVHAKRETSGSITDPNQFNGIQPPRLTREELTTNTAIYSGDQKGVLIYITNTSGGNSLGQRIKIDATGYYYFDGTIWQKLSSRNTTVNQYTIGTIKSSVRATDHNGWYLMDGRSISTLATNAQTASIALGITANIPNATDRVLKSKSETETFGTTGGSNSLTIAQDNLPSFTMNGNIVSGITNSAGAHDHAPNVGNSLLTTSSGQPFAPQYTAGGGAWGSTGTGGTAASGAHTHTVSATAEAIDLGGSGNMLNNRSAYLVVNTFIYLGE